MLLQQLLVAFSSRRLGEGMETPDFRYTAFQHYATFRALAQSYQPSFTV
jgi:hypothetical protein